MAQHRIALVTRGPTDAKLVEDQLKGMDYELEVRVCNSEGETIGAIRGADVIMSREIDKAQAIGSFNPEVRAKMGVRKLARNYI